MKDLFLLLLTSSTLVFPSLASFCGSSGVPFSFEVLPSGAPVLGCAQPSCVASPEDREDSNFLVNADGQSDGFLREGDKELRRSSDPYPNKLIANCSGKFADLTCPRKDQWVGGIEYIDHPRQPLILQCCTFAGLRFSQEVGVTNVGPGEAITGGEVIRDGRQISFDVIANARKVVDANTHVVSYEVTVRRMNCLPDPPEPVVEYEKGVNDEVVKVLTKASDRATYQKEKTLKKEELREDGRGDRAFGAPIQKADERKQPKKAGPEEGWNFNTYAPDRSPQAIQTYQQTVGQLTDAGTFSTSDAASFANSQSTISQQPAGRQPNLEVGAGGTGSGGFSGGFGSRQISPELYGQGQSFGQPLQMNTYEIQEPQLPSSFGPSQQAYESNNQPGVSQSFQPGSGGFYGPCVPQCNRVACPPRHCNNDGRDPIFGFPTFAPPPTFPTIAPFTLPPHTFPTFPPHTFPTPAPHTFPTLALHTYPTVAPPPPHPAFAGFLGPSGSGGDAPAAFGAPTHIAAAAVDEVPGDGSSGGGLAPLSSSPAAPGNATPELGNAGGSAPAGAPLFSGGRAPGATFAPIPSFEELFARLGNMTPATLPPLTFGMPSTLATTPVALPAAAGAIDPAAARSGGYPDVFVRSVGIVPSSSSLARHDQTSNSNVFHASQQWLLPTADFASNALPQTQSAVFQQT